MSKLIPAVTSPLCQCGHSPVKLQDSNMVVEQSDHAVGSESMDFTNNLICELICRAQWLRGRALDSRLRDPGFESGAAVLKPWASLFTLHCSSLLSCINEYLAIDSGGYVYEQPSRINCTIWLDASQRSRDGV